MKVAVVGSRNLHVNLEAYIPKEATEIISGGARGIDALAERYAKAHGLRLRVIKPDFTLLGKWACLVRNDQIVDEADMIVAIWDGVSRGTRYTIERANRTQKPVVVHIISP